MTLYPCITRTRGLGDREKELAASPSRRVSASVSLRLLMGGVLTATPAELAELETFSRRLLVLSRYVIATFAISALQHDVVTRHSLVSPLSDKL